MKKPSADRGGPWRVRERWLLRVIRFQLRYVNVARLAHAGLGVGDSAPIVGTRAAPAGGHFHLALALDAGRAERQGVEPGDRDLLLAHLALAEDALFQAI